MTQWLSVGQCPGQSFKPWIKESWVRTRSWTWLNQTESLSECTPSQWLSHWVTLVCLPKKNWEPRPGPWASFSFLGNFETEPFPLCIHCKQTLTSRINAELCRNSKICQLQIQKYFVCVIGRTPRFLFFWAAQKTLGTFWPKTQNLRPDTHSIYVKKC